jgi:phage shock protein PspC (stress-responsive transcriptional regulator)
MRERLYRSRRDRVIGGVAGGVADALDIDPSIVRVIWVILAFMTGGIAAFIYLVMLIVVPEEPGDDFDWTTVPPASPAGTYPGAVPGDQEESIGFDEPGRPVLREETGSAFAPPPPAYPPESRPVERQEARRARRAERGTGGPGGGALVFGLILILIGGYFLLRQFVPALDLGLIWPVVVIVLGLVLILGSLRSRDRGAG